MLKKLGLLTAGLAMAGGVAYGDNNVVKTLKVESVGNKSAFELKLTGYVQVSNVKSSELTFVDSSGQSKRVTVRNNKALARLQPGKYTVNANDVTVKKIGENLFYSVVGAYNTDEIATVTVDNKTSGKTGMFLYNWNYLRNNILDPFAVITLGSAYAPEIDQWRAEGRMVFRNCNVTNPADGKRGLPFWDELGANAQVDGIGPDEFIVPAGRKDPNDASLGYTRPGHGFTEAHLQGIRNWSKKYPDKTFYAWVGIPWNGDCTAIKPLYDAVKSSPNGVILWEAYLSGDGGEKDLARVFTNRGRDFKAVSGGTLADYIIAPATYEYMDNNGEIDFKVLLDYQFHLMATDPVFADLRGFGMWVAYYTEPEILRWYAKLVQHYGVDGETTHLSDKYGYKLYPGILGGHNWDNRRNDWQLTGNAAIVDKKAAKLNQGYLPFSNLNLLRLEVGPGKKGGVSQVMKNLKPGQLYMVKVNYFTPDDPEKSDIAIDISLENAVVLESTLRYVQDFTRRSPHVYNFRKIVFRAGDKPVRLTIGGRVDAAQSKVVMIDQVQAAPYFAE
ncbi:MAG: hypothetical protein E7047_06535 [Lentisphaerae bacterium]|nr:hypothetical protein [Lentisphaerota bacterium]